MWANGLLCRGEGENVVVCRRRVHFAGQRRYLILGDLALDGKGTEKRVAFMVYPSENGGHLSVSVQWWSFCEGNELSRQYACSFFL